MVDLNRVAKNNGRTLYIIKAHAREIQRNPLITL